MGIPAPPADPSPSKAAPGSVPPSIENPKESDPSSLQSSTSANSLAAPVAVVQEKVRCDDLFSYSYADHMRKPLCKKLVDIRKAKDIPKFAWECQLLVEDEFGNSVRDYNCADLEETHFPVIIKWQWLRRQDVSQFRWKARARFYWKGLTQNTGLRTTYMRLQSKLRVLRSECDALFDDIIDDDLEKKEAIRKHVCNGIAKSSRLKLARKTLNITKSKKLELMRATHLSGTQQLNVIETIADSTIPEGYNDVEIAAAKDGLRILESLIKREFRSSAGSVTTDQLFQMAGVPFDDFMLIYVRDRDDALEKEDSTERKRELIKALTKGVDGLECMCGYLQEAIDQNDQLLFKIVLMLVNLIGALGQFLYTDYVNKPTWRKKIDWIYDIVSVGS